MCIRDSHRAFTTGFYFRKPTGEDHQYSDSSYIRNYDFVGMVLGYDEDRGLIEVEQRNAFGAGDVLEIMVPGEDYIDYTVTTMLDEEARSIDRAPHPQQKIYLPLDRNIPRYSILRRKQAE